MQKFNAATVIMGQKRDYTDDGIISFQSNVDDFFQIWVTVIVAAPTIFICCIQDILLSIHVLLAQLTSFQSARLGAS